MSKHTLAADLSNRIPDLAKEIAENRIPVIEALVDTHLPAVSADIIDLVEEMLTAACWIDHEKDGPCFDSMANSTWAEGIRFLAAHGRVQIVREMSHRWIVAKKL